MLPVVGNEIVEGEAVVTGHEVDALFGLPFLVTINLQASDQAVGETRRRACFAPTEVTSTVPESPVPLFPAIADKRANLVEACCVPGFRDQFGSGQTGVRFDVPEDRRVL